MRGGARGRSGPPPDPNALRRDRKDDAPWRTLPADGREGDVPVWPLADPTRREELLWEKEWSRPQAVEWERNGQELEVAMYVRTLIAAEKHDATANMRTLLRQQQESLGLSLTGLAKNRWRIGEVEVEAEVRRVAPSARGRLEVVGG